MNIRNEVKRIACLFRFEFPNYEGPPAPGGRNGAAPPRTIIGLTNGTPMGKWTPGGRAMPIEGIIGAPLPGMGGKPGIGPGAGAAWPFLALKIN
ncbi:hypothetical protein WR25_20747 [Diploscapter pachys]|uniref:Uncharacterized protein n=1 Tax=Diploscapter pachys TaxID=2018661 RepID=A0A2A2JUI7_9BILA|nr:hypothetical protein WR25_20747 [Diploscapter pachys]